MFAGSYRLCERHVDFCASVGAKDFLDVSQDCMVVFGRTLQYLKQIHETEKSK